MTKTKTTDQIFHTDMGVRVRVAEEDVQKTGQVRVVRIMDGHEFNIDRSQLKEVKKWVIT